MLPRAKAVNSKAKRDISESSTLHIFARGIIHMRARVRAEERRVFMAVEIGRRRRSALSEISKCNSKAFLSFPFIPSHLRSRACQRSRGFNGVPYLTSHTLSLQNDRWIHDERGLTCERRKEKESKKGKRNRECQ